ncbi:MAG: DMT family transporter [Planctomycetaceae bacterium]|nr:DMT family transporter [Planctomycetaceae bacterium]
MIVESISWKTHLLLALKSLLVGASWILALYALKHLPMSIAAPIRATSPFFTILISVTLMDERPSAGQWTGIIIILTAFYAFSVVGRAEGIHFHRNRWVGLMIAATILGAASALYDKHLLQNLALKPATVQAWFSVYLVPVMIPLAAHWFRNERQNAPFEWRWSIPMIAVLLLLSDFLYFTAIGQPDALISVISPLRRTSLVIAFVAGIRMYGETNWRPKLLCVLGILAGVYVLSLSR